MSKSTQPKASTQSITNLLEDESIDPNASKVLSRVLIQDPNVVGQACIGVPVENLDTDDPTLLAIVLDGSGSMEDATDGVIKGFNEGLLGGLVGAKGGSEIIASLWIFNDQSDSVFAHVKVEEVEKLDRRKYRPFGSTALYDTTLKAITGLQAYAVTLQQAGIIPRCLVVVVSDGADNASRRTASEVRSVIQSCLRQENWTFGFAGAKTFEGASVDFNKVAKNMGIESIIVVDAATPHDWRQLFSLVSKSVIRKSQTAVGQTSQQNPADFLDTL